MWHEFQLNTSAEREWRRLQPHFQLSDYFILGFIFSDNGAVNNLLHDRLAAMYRAHISGLQPLLADSPQTLLEEILPRLVRGSVKHQALQAPIWLDLSALAPTPAWQRARLDLLARLNERREQMRKHLTVPLVLVLPLSEKRQIRELAPDLWAIRNFAVDVDDWLELLPTAEHLPALESEPINSTTISPPSALTTAFVREWQRLQERSSTERSVLSAAGRAIDALSSEGTYERAEAIAKGALHISRSRLQNLGETPEVLHDLSISLVKIGDTARAQGKWRYAQEVYLESLELCRKQFQRSGETTEVLRDLSLSLHRVGDVASNQGQWQRAQELYYESLELSRKLLQRLGETPETLRDLLVSLNNAGDAASDQDHWQHAQELYLESLELSRKLLQRSGETPDTLRDLSLSLDRVGDVAQAQGQWQRAQKLYEECIELIRKRLQLLGESPEILRDLLLALSKVGEVARTQGQWQRAQELYLESLELSRKLLQHSGENPQTLRDLAVSLWRVGYVARAQNQQQRAHESWSEGLAVAQKLAERFPDMGDHQDLVDNFEQRLAELQA